MATPIPDNDAAFSVQQLSRLFGAPTGAPIRTSDMAPDADLRGVATDSRRVRPGQLYVALSGEQFDGHAFLPQVAGTAGAAIVRRGTALPPGLPAFEVDDTLVALGALARAHRRRWTGRVVAITGSAGKTTTKELTAAALDQACGNVLRTRGNLNNRIGVPMTLLTLTPEVQLAVIEAGTSMPGEIAALTQMIEPDVAVVTSVAVAHVAGLGSLDAVADEKVCIFDGLREDGVAVYSADSAALRERVDGMPPTRLSFGMAADASVRLLSQELGPDLRARCSFALPGFDEPVEVVLRMLGVGPALDAGAALACVLACVGREALEPALRGLASQSAVPGRLCLEVGASGCTLIDDSYNANPASMRASLQTLVQAARVRGGRAIALLGDMGELGSEAAAQHALVGQAAGKLGVHTLLGCGPEMAGAVQAAREAGVAVVHHVDSPVEAATLLGELGSKDVVLVKGSRSMRMERALTALRGQESQ